MSLRRAFRLEHRRDDRGDHESRKGQPQAGQTCKGQRQVTDADKNERKRKELIEQ